MDLHNARCVAFIGAFTLPSLGSVYPALPESKDLLSPRLEGYLPMEPIHLIAAEDLTVNANPFFPNLVWFTNSMLVTIVVTLIILIWARRSTQKMELVPKGVQNLFEALVEILYTTFEGVVGRHMIPKVFSLLATLFIFILTANWFGLIPGVGTIGFGKPGGGFGSLEEIVQPLLRPVNADLNMTFGMAVFFFAWWIIWTVQEVGVIGFLKHTFEPKGGVKGFLKLALFPLFIFVGIIELFSIFIRPVSLSFRLFGNIFAGETLLHSMATIGASLPWPLSWLALILFPLPFYFLELLVGVLQAFVFAMLCAVYIKLSTGGEEEGAHH
jgi:F-type H+-transporting ATPase subunit a